VRVQAQDSRSRFGLRRIVAWMLALQLAVGLLGGAAYAEGTGGATADAAAALRSEVAQAAGDLQNILSAAQPLDDWTAFALARSGQPKAAQYLPEAKRAADSGELRLVTDYARTALAVIASGGDARNVGQKHTDLLAQIANHDKMTAQGPNGPAFALLALDAGGYKAGAADRWSQSDLVAWLVGHRNADGGWSLTGTGTSDVDLTAMVLTALAPYRDSADVGAAVDGALAWLSNKQLESGGFGAPTESSESAAYAVIALTSLGIDPAADPRFVKNGHSALSRLLEFRLPNGRFAHTPGGKADGMATLQALLGLTAAERWWNGLPALYAPGMAASAAVTVTVDGPEGRLAEGTAAGTTALEDLLQVLDAQHVSYDVERHPQFGAYLQAVSGIESGRFGGYDGWQFAVRRGDAWVPIQEGLGTFVPKAGDHVYVYYGGTDTAVLHAVKVEPSEPREGRPFTVTVEKETTDWTTGRTTVAPAAGAQVEVGGIAAKTDENGQATISGLAAGSYTLSVDGYQDGKPPLYVAWESPLRVTAYEKRVAVRIEGDQGTIAAGNAQGGTALEAAEQLLKASGVPYEVQNFSYGKLLTSVNGVQNGKYGGYDGWMFAVRRDGGWIVPSVGIDAMLLEDGDEVVVYYSGDGTKLADIRVTPAQPLPGQPFTVTATYRDWDWDQNAFGETKPLAGVAVTAGDAAVVTDAEGTARFAGLPEGAYRVAVTGYRPDGAPSAARAVATLTVAQPYADEASVSAWAREAVRAAKAAGLMRSREPGADAFAPKRAATRAEFVSALVRAIGAPAAPDAKAAPFADVPPSAWYAADLAAAQAAGLARGVGGGRFAPDAAVTREQAAELVARALRLKAQASADIRDAAQIAPDARSAVDAVLEGGWMTLDGGRFAPKAPLTREQAAVVAARIWSKPGYGAAAKP